MFEYGAIVWVREWVSGDGEEESWSQSTTEWYADKAEMKEAKRFVETHPDEKYQWDFFKIKKWYEVE